MSGDLRRLLTCCRFLRVSRIVLYILGSVVSSGIQIAVPVLLGIFVDALVCDGNAVLSFASLLALALMQLLTSLALKKFALRMGRQEEQELQICLVDAIRLSRPGAIGTYRGGELTMKFFRDAGVIGQFVSGVFPQILNALIGSLLALAIVVFKTPLIALLVLLFLLVEIVVLFPYRRQFSRVNRSTRVAYDKSMNGIFEFIRVLPYLKSIAAEAPYVNSPKIGFRRCKKFNTFNDRVAISFESFNRAILLLGEYSVLGFAGLLAWRHVVTIGDVVVFQVLFLSAFNAISGVFQILPSFEAAKESARSLDELFPKNMIEDVDAGNPAFQIRGSISVRNISFSYGASSRDVFKGFSCEVKCGHIVALTGANGTGKTTLLKLILGALEPSCGDIEISGVNLSSWQKQAFRKKVAAVFQDELVLTGTIRDNITLKDEKYTEVEIEEALRLSGADSLVRRMPEGLNHRIGVEGGGLSGGERQKVAIARALIRKPSILVFDEVTNHLDYESRCNVKELLQSLRGDVTVLIVSHDPELLAVCDEIVELPAYDAGLKEKR